ncbi:hypothetical protein R3P38DRAFT_2493589 [Favolaschia claudopus]|uniref:Structure-specific endonuclease subunit SLX4 n=1 Tax=Favolaschia claudopus TaxID=2862362 RepID=A0AAW0EBZ1_9AGAR
MNAPTAAPPKTSVANVIVISDDSSTPASPHAAASVASASTSRSQAIVIDISDSSLNASVNVNPISVDSGTSEVIFNSVAVSERLVEPQDQSEDEEIIPTLNLARFAFAQPKPRPLKSQNSVATVESASSTDSLGKPAAKKSTRVPSKEPVSDAQLNKILKCVCCDLAWTARKTASQKMVHIRSCAKKRGFTEETIQVLLGKELAASAAKGGTTLVPIQRTTLLEDVVRKAGPKQKGKRKAVGDGDVLKSVSETRENILNNARTILGPETANEDDFIAQTQAIAAKQPTRSAYFCQTQVLGPSRLGQQHAPKASLFGEQDAEEEEELAMPPATQAFAPSKLGGRSMARGWGYESDSESESSEPLAQTSSLHPLPTSKSKQGNAVPKSFFASDDDSDDAYVHYEPSKEIHGTKGMVLTEATTSQTRANIVESIHGKLMNFNLNSPGGGPSNPPNAKPKPKKNKTKNKEEYDENWERELKEKILADNELYHRILRYEPLNFDIFVKLATDEDPTARLRLQLRSFLDKQAINFYGGEAQTSRRKRRR